MQEAVFDCGEHLVLFRGTEGAVVALDDSCSHRGYPLSAGALIDDEVQCGYHGLRFDTCGTCVWAPGQDRVPSKANITQSPIVERGPWVWAWLGEVADVDYAALPETPWLSDDAWATVQGWNHCLLATAYSSTTSSTCRMRPSFTPDSLGPPRWQKLPPQPRWMRTQAS